MITVDLLKAVHAGSKAAGLYAPLLETARVVSKDDFNTITSINGIAMLVSQLAHESGYFKVLSENLNYSTEALSHHPRANYFTEEQAKTLGYQRDSSGMTTQVADQQAIANLYYGGRLGNRGILTNDGWVFRGAGLIQLTGRSNFTIFGGSIGMRAEEAAEYARTPEGAVASAMWYWRNRGLLVPASRGDVSRCTEMVQGGSGGLASRIALFQSAKAALE